MKTNRRVQQRESGVALVVTVIVVAMLAVVGAALMQSMTVDQLSSRSVANYYRSQLAADAGLVLATQWAKRYMTNDHFIIAANPNNGALFVGLGTNNAGAALPAGTIGYRPLFSFTPDIETMTNTNASAAGFQSTAGLPVTRPPDEPAILEYVPVGGEPDDARETPPYVSWTYLTDEEGATSGRVAYWVEDLAGRVDLSVAGSTNGPGSPQFRRATGTNPAELALWATLTNNVTQGLSAASQLAARRISIVSPATTLEAATEPIQPLVTRAMVISNFATSLIHDTNEVELIPYGFGYADAGSRKFNLNTNLSANGISSIPAIISSNLPQFAQRAGGYTNAVGGGAQNADAYTPASYLQTLAASIIDYADTDSNPTTDGTPLSTNRVRPIYRGVDSHPFVNEISKRYALLSANLVTFNGVEGRMVVIETRDFLELWNPSSQPASGSLVYVSVHRQELNLGFGSFRFSAPTAASNSLGPVFNGTTSNTFSVTLNPNAFGVFACPPVTNYFFVPATNALASLPISTEVNDSSYHVSWNGTYYDAVLGGILRLQVGNLLTAPANRGNLPSFIYRPSANVFANPAVGDPRATIYLSLPVDAAAYGNNSSFGGRNVRSGISLNEPYAQVSVKDWPDGGHNSPGGNAAGTLLPTAVAPASYSNVPPSRIANAGSFSNVLELGAIFDPIQWRMPSLGAWEGKWTNLGTDGVAANAFGGGNTLRVGRAEHPKFTNDGQRASQLLDLFTVSNGQNFFTYRTNNTVQTNTNVIVNRVSGRININTATTSALRALAAGVYHGTDSALLPGGTNFVVPPTAVSNFATAVSSWRSMRPFFSVSELPNISTNTNPANWLAGTVFGSTNFGVQEWSDAAAEEWFSRIYRLSTVRSRNFMVYVIGQALQPGAANTNVFLPPVKRAYQVYLRPERSTNGVVTNTLVEILQTWDL